MAIFFETGGANFDAFACGEFCPLEIGVTTLVAGWVEFSSTDSV